ncbi:immunity 53 family protein [Frankia sp. Cas4]|uniref:immunity 53 family protein n=1 Tax=Frankia sp. Cas4 TaxID=3073927 RepID=UPI002AD250AD|nr:immunity 53 family protein [Frankia sp. Cas4]
MGSLDYLQEWYIRHCDGDWEHALGIRITTLDNPGWMLTVNVEGTELAGRKLDWVRYDESETAWLHYRSDGREFIAACGPQELNRALEVFERFAEECGSIDPRASE